MQGAGQDQKFCWPRRMQVQSSAPTTRGMGDFATGVAWCRKFAQKVNPRGAVVKHSFAEVAMGFPKGWTVDPAVSGVAKP